ncbi:MAG: L,D-transpeptidase family protein [Gammaproteobacteria bacterium]
MVCTHTLNPAHADGIDEHLRFRIEDTMAGTPLTVSGHRLHTQSALIKHYTEHLFKPVWIENEHLSSTARQLIDALNRADKQGLDPNLYHVTTIGTQVSLLDRSNDSAERIERSADLDLLLSDAFLSYSTHLSQGLINPETLDSKWEIDRKAVDIICALTDAANETELSPILDNLTPRHRGYRLLLNALADYRHIAANGGWNQVKKGPKLSPGDYHPRIAQLRRRLLTTGDPKPADDTGSLFYDKPLSQAVRLFQQRHGLEIDAVVGKATLKALNIPVQKRIDHILTNLERWRWLPADLGERYIMVNIAGYELFFVDANRIALRMPVVVGKTYRETPVFSGKMTYLVVNPSWHVPTTIAVEDKLPLIRNNPYYLEEHNMKLFRGRGAEASEIDPLTVDWYRLNKNYFPYHIVQGPGPQNALGKIKFMFPNKHNVYLHDTSEPWLFNKSIRSFSSGCIRVAEPYVLAERVLENNTRLSPETVAETFDSDEEKIISLRHPIPIHVLYWTAWVDEAGLANFRKDIYGRDRALIKAIRSASLNLH